MSAPLAYFLTWTCHGTWFHGDERGSVDKLHNTPGTQLLPEDAARVVAERESLRNAPPILDEESRAIVDTTVRAHCEIRGWRVLALNVRSNHVHVVVQCPESVAPEVATEQFKAWSTRRLREAGKVAAQQRVWTSHGSTRWLNHQAGLEAAISCVLNGQ